VTDPAIGVVAVVMVAAAAVVVGALLIVMVVLRVVMLLRVLVVMVMVVMVAAVVFLSTLDVLQLQVHHVMLSGTIATAAAVVVVGDLVAIQILVAEPVAAERLGGQVVPRLDGFDGAVVTPVRRRRLRLDRVLPGSGRWRLLASSHRVVVPVQCVRAQ